MRMFIRSGHNRGPTTHSNLMTDQLGDTELRGAAAFQQLHWLASGRIDSAHLTHAYAGAIARDNPHLNAWISLDPRMEESAAASDARRREGRTIGRLDGLAVAIKDNLDVAGLPTTVGLPDVVHTRHRTMRAQSRGCAPPER